MAGINYASKYSPVVDEKFALASLTQGMANSEYDWTGVSTVNVYSIPDVALGDYTTSGSNRYGNPSELEDEVQEMTLSQDKAFTFTIDRKNYDDTMMTKEAGKRLAREILNVVVPTIDAYRIGKAFAGAGNTTTETVTSSNAYDCFLEAQAKLDDDKIPAGGRICYVTPQFYKKIKLDDAFIKAGDLSQNITIKGFVGEIDGVAVIKAPSSYFPAKSEFVILNPIAMVSPIKLQDYKIHDNPPGISGWLVEGRIRYDAFVLNNKADAISVCVAP